MPEDLKIIKKLYGEAMMHFCRDHLSTVLEEKGKLPEILQDNFAPSHLLYEDLVAKEMTEEFKSYIYDLCYKTSEESKILSVLSPQELMRQTGYILYECKTEEDIQFFKRYYIFDEELCTFHGRRLEYCYVFFAVKENADEVKRDNFPNPKRQDEYGTSVISIQFSRDNSHTLSIKNRYNHTVENPDATFGNNLDNIIEGLTESFEKYYGMKQEHKNEGFELPGYVRANDGKWYKYNYEIDNIYYCPDNIIIDHGEVHKYDKEKCIIIDYFILDLEEKELYIYDADIFDSFPNIIREIKKVTVVKNGKEKEITIINGNDEEIKIIIDKTNQIIGLKSKDIKQVGNNFLSDNLAITKLELPNLTQVGENFLCENADLVTLDLPSLQQVGDYFLSTNIDSLVTLKLPELQKVGNYFLFGNQSLTSIDLPKLKEVGHSFINDNRSISVLKLPELIKVGNKFLFDNEALASLNLPNLRLVGDYFMYQNAYLSIVELPLLQQAGDIFLINNQELGNRILAQIKEQQELKR